MELNLWYKFLKYNSWQLVIWYKSFVWIKKIVKRSYEVMCWIIYTSPILSVRVLLKVEVRIPFEMQPSLTEETMLLLIITAWKHMVPHFEPFGCDKRSKSPKSPSSIMKKRFCFCFLFFHCIYQLLSLQQWKTITF